MENVPSKSNNSVTLDCHSTDDFISTGKRNPRNGIRFERLQFNQIAVGSVCLVPCSAEGSSVTAKQQIVLAERWWRNQRFETTSNAKFELE